MITTMGLRGNYMPMRFESESLLSDLVTCLKDAI